MLSAKISRQKALHQLIRLGLPEIHIAVSNPNIDIRILAQGHFDAIVSLSLLGT